MRDVQAEELGSLIRTARTAKGLSKVALAKRLDVHSSTITYLEQGIIAKPKPKMLEGIARELGLALDDLYALSGYASKESLPTLKVYLRSKYGLNAAEAAEVEAHFNKLKERKRKGGSRARTSK